MESTGSEKSVGTIGMLREKDEEITHARQIP